MVSDWWTNIEGALNTKLADDFTDTTVIFENQAGSDGEAIEALNATHMEAYFLPGAPSVIEIGVIGRERAVGIFQVTIRTPLYKGKYEANQLRDRLITSFAKGTVLTLDGVDVRVTMTAYPTQSSRNGSYFEMPVSIVWRSDTVEEA